MKKEIEPYIDDLKHSLDYIIKRNCDIDPKTLGTFDAEKIDVEVSSFIVFICGKKICIDAFTPIKDVKYVADNIDAVEYIYSEADDSDSVVGYISLFISDIIDGCDIIKASYEYIKYIESVNHVFTKRDAVSYIKGVVYETFDRRK